MSHSAFGTQRRFVAMTVFSLLHGGCVLFHDAGGADGGGGGSGGGPGSGPVTTTGPACDDTDCCIETGENCADCNAASGDGCSASGNVESGWICPEVGEACVQLEHGPPMPEDLVGDAKTPSESVAIACPKRSLLIGVRASFIEDDLGLMSGIAPICAPMIVTGANPTQGAVLGWTAPMATPQAIGDFTEAADEVLCDADEFVVGLEISTTGFDEGLTGLKGISLQCAPLEVPFGPALRFERGAIRTTSSLGAEAGPTTVVCAKNDTGVGLFGRAPALVHALTILCAPLSTE